MFTGIIEDVGRVEQDITSERGRCLRISSNIASELSLGQSVAVNGVCLTVAQCTPEYFEVVAVPETLRKTNLGELQRGAPVNLERALQVGSRLDGHLVQGHVDATCPIVDQSIEGQDRFYTLQCPDEWSHLIILTGSITIDGISLTIARLHNQHVTVAIVPFTYEHTIVRTWQPGTLCNVEFDVLGKYVARQQAIRPKA